MSTDDDFTTERTYIHVRASDESLQPQRVSRAIRRLHRIEVGGFLESTTKPTYEWLFVATGEAGETGERRIDWYVGVDGEDAVNTVKRCLRQSLPMSVDLVECDRSYETALDIPDPCATHEDGADDTGERGRLPGEWEVAGLEWEGVGSRPDDWQYPLPSLTTFDGDWPLTGILNGLATTHAPTIVQILITPKPDWTTERDDRIIDLELHSDLRRNAFAQAVIVPLLSGSETETEMETHTHRTSRNGRRTENASIVSRKDPKRRHDTTMAAENARRVEGIETAETRESFTVNARAVAFGSDDTRPHRTLRELESGFAGVRSEYYRVEATRYDYGTTPAADLFDRLCDRTLHTSPKRRGHILPWRQNASPAIVVDRYAAGAFVGVNGSGVSPATSRALEPTPDDRTGIELPPRSVLDDYLDTEGMTVGRPKTADRVTLETDLTLPPSIQSLHVALFGSTGAGKTAVGQGMHLENHAATDGATIYIDSKGDGGPEQYARMHFARYDDLEDVYYFDCSETLPGLPFLTIEPLVADGLDREWAVNTVTEHYIDLLAAAMGREQFYNAEAAVEVIEQLVRALFDPVHGTDAIDQQDLLAAATHFHETGAPPPVSDGTLHQKLASTAANAHKTFDSIMGAVIRRIGVLTNDRRLAPLFEGHVDVDSTFDLRAALDEDCVIVLDMSGYGERSRTLLSVVVLSQLWRALQRRRAVTADGTTLPLVNCYIEEAADLATTDVLDTLLSQGRGFDLSLTLAMQFPGQLRSSHPRVYDELLNDVGTIITGNVGVDHRLAERLATSDMPAESVNSRIGILERGEWLVQPAAPFAERKPQPFVVASAPLPAGHPEGSDPWAAGDPLSSTVSESAKTRAAENHGVPVGRPASGSVDPTSLEGPVSGSVAALAAATATIPHTERFPDRLSYIDEPPYPLVCPKCDTRYASTPEGMRRAIECHNTIEDVDRDDIPVCSLDLQLTSGERAASAYTDAQLRLLTAVYMAHQQRFDPILEYDLVWDSMTMLEAYVGIETDAVQELLDDDLLRVDCRRPHKLYTVTPAGRDAIGIGHREGIAYGDGTGDLSESSLHVAMVEVGARLFEQELVGPDAPGTRVARYQGVEDGRLDVAVLDETDEIIATLEAERINNDRAEAIPADFDKMAACGPEQSWWLVKARGDGHQILKALHDPADDDPRVERTYSENMAPREYRLDTAGLTDVYTFEYARDTLLEETEPVPGSEFESLPNPE